MKRLLTRPTLSTPLLSVAFIWKYTSLFLAVVVKLTLVTSAEFVADPSLAVNEWTTGASSSILFTSNLNDADDAGLVKSEADHIISSSKSPKSN